MSQLEKAARAIYEARAKRHGFTVSWEQAGIVDQDRARHDARAVIASIEPDDAMVEAARHAYSHGPDGMRSALQAFLRALGEKG